ncbi:hypothetical protein Vadar_013899 [Vaccinium darrowii]|uniref:Uncharacterized protein n=1 Tax=Vaccinium darrowii TaxID=229202 RepID=A0ACB7XHP8_9ERIC|nr:hypothetical protein Vadar_013899 [Vaccinium darrowii]
MLESVLIEVALPSRIFPFQLRNTTAAVLRRLEFAKAISQFALHLSLSGALQVDTSSWICGLSLWTLRISRDFKNSISEWRKEFMCEAFEARKKIWEQIESGNTEKVVKKATKNKNDSCPYSISLLGVRVLRSWTNSGSSVWIDIGISYNDCAEADKCSSRALCQDITVKE